MGQILPMIRRFNEDYFGIPIDPTKTIAMVATVIEDGQCFISERGFIGGLIAHDLFRQWTVLHELGWYAEDRSGITLLDAFIKAGRELSVDEVRISTLTTSSAMVGRILQRRGFAPLETSYRLITGAASWPQPPQSSRQSE